MVPRPLIFGLMGLLIVVALAGIVALSAQRYTPYAQSRIGGPFTMLDTSGRTVTEADLQGRPSAMFFGYTSCPDVCPTTLSSLTAVLERMGAAADRLQVVFVTVDPDRDTLPRLRDYLSSFDPRIRALAGTRAQTEAMADAYHVHVRRVDTTSGAYTVDHTSTVYLMDAQSRLAGEINYGENEDRMLAKLTALARSREAPSDKATRTDLWADAARLAKQLCGF